MTRPTETHTVEIKWGKATLNKSLTDISDNAQELVLQCTREMLAGSTENMHKIAHTHGSSLISMKKLVSMGKLLTRCCRMAIAKALKNVQE
jgi:hypothetical protein